MLANVKDAFGEFRDAAGNQLYWVSFLDGMQRVLLFTEDIAIMTMAQQVRVVKCCMVAQSRTGISSSSSSHLFNTG